MRTLVDRLRSISSLTALGVGTLIVTALIGILGILDGPGWSRIALSAVLLAIGLGALYRAAVEKRKEMAIADEKKRQDTDAEGGRWIRAVTGQFLLGWPPPTLESINPYDLGVRRSTMTHLASAQSSGMTPYVPRDIDKQAAEQLQRSGHVLLIGEPASGVTRTAWELVAKAHPDSRVLAPQSPDGMKNALGELDVAPRLAPRSRLVLWLDRIHDFGADGVSPQMLRQLRRTLPGTRIVATIPAGPEYTKWVTDNRAVADMFEPIVLRRLPSRREKEVAQKVCPDVDVTEGIAAAFTAVTTLIHRMNAGYQNCPDDPGGTCVLARDIVNTVIDWAGTGTPRGLSVNRVLDLHTHGRNIRFAPAHVNAVIDWAATPVAEGVSLVRIGPLGADGERVVFAHRDVAASQLISSSGRPPPSVWLAAISEAAAANDSEAVGQIGFTAHTDGKRDHAKSAWEHITTLTEPATSWLYRALEYSRQRVDHSGEISCQNPLLDLRAKKYGCDHTEVAGTLSDLGRAWLGLGKSERALDLHQRALTIQENANGTAHPDVARALGDLGNDYARLGDYDTALKHHQRALAILENEYGADHRAIVDALSNMGGTWSLLGQYNKSLDHHQRAFTILKREYGAGHLTLSSPLTNLGDVYFRMSLCSKAREHHQTALTIVEKVCGLDHPLLAHPLNGLGNANIGLHEYGKALGYYRRALRLTEKLYGPDHPAVSMALSNVGIALSRLGNYEEARDIQLRALAVVEGKYGPDHIAVGRTLGSLAEACAGSGESTDALEYYLRALQIHRRHGDHAHVKHLLSYARRIDPYLTMDDNGTVIRTVPGEH